MKKKVCDVLAGKKLIFKKGLFFSLITFFLVACSQSSTHESEVTCKKYADEHNGTFLNASYILRKDTLYVVQKGISFVAPVVDGEEIRVEIKMIDINDDYENDCVSVKQDKNDMHDAYIDFY